jgi:hypothetical protein
MILNFGSAFVQVDAEVGGCDVEFDRITESTPLGAAVRELRLARLASSVNQEQANTFRLNKYTAAEQKRRVEIERILELRRRAPESSWLRRPARQLRYWTALHRLLVELDTERERRWRSGAQQSIAKTAGLWGMLRRIALHARRNATVSYTVLPDRTFICSVRGWTRTAERRAGTQLRPFEPYPELLLLRSHSLSYDELASGHRRLVEFGGHVARALNGR